MVIKPEEHILQKEVDSFCKFTTDNHFLINQGKCYVMKFNGACLQPTIPRPLTGNTALKVKYIDDATQAASVNLKKSLMTDPK